MSTLARICRLVPLLLLLSLALAPSAHARRFDGASASLSPAMREQLGRAAEGQSLPSWQRDLMLQLAREGTPVSSAENATGFRAESPAGATTADGNWTQLTVMPRRGHSTIYDPVRRRMIVFGGTQYYDSADHDMNDVWALSLSGSPTWTRLTPSGTLPPARLWHSAIYDPVRDRMVVYGGWSSSGVLYLGDVWALSLGDAPAWTQLAPTGTPPGARRGHVAIYDPVRDRMVVFGGGGGGMFNDVWALSLAGTPAWTLLATTGTPPSVRQWASGIYDPVRDRLVVFGGSGNSGVSLSDTYALTLSTLAWSGIAGGAAPGARYWHSAIYDTVNGRMVVYGGYTASGAITYGDTWTLSLGDTPAWTQLTFSGVVPRARDSHTAIYDPAAGRMMVFGGLDGGSYLDAVWQLSLGGSPEWTQMTPAQRYNIAGAWDSSRNRMLVFGGTCAVTGMTNDVWALSLACASGWTAITPTGTPPSARDQYAAIYDPVRDRLIVFGGQDASAKVNDVWALSLSGTPAWTQLAPSGIGPSPRRQCAAIYDPVRDRMIVFGGVEYWYLNEVWALSLAGTPAWSQITPTGTPPSGRVGMGMAYDSARDRVLVFGGWDNTRCSDTWALSLSGTPAWTQLAPAGTPPSGRNGHCAVYDVVRDRLIVYGGSDGSYKTDAWALTLSGTPTWAQLLPTGAVPFTRSALAGVYDRVRDRLVVYGGYGSTGYASDAWALEWSATAGVGDPVLPAISELRPPLPNPSRGSTTLRYSLALAGHARLEIYDASGRLVRRLVDGERPAGSGSARWDGTNDSGGRVGAGLYFVRLVGPGTRSVRRVIMLK